jgi:hypothetical protein
MPSGVVQLESRIDMNDTIARHREIWFSKPALRAVYADCYRRIADRIIPGGRVRELGGGSGNLKSFASLRLIFSSRRD